MAQIKQNRRVHLTHKGAMVKVDTLGIEYARKLKKFFTLSVNGFENRILYLPMSSISIVNKTKYITIPRFGMLEILTSNKSAKYGLDGYKIVNNIKLTPEHSISIERTGVFKGNQEVVHNYLMKNIYNPINLKFGCAGCILNMDTGQGKSYSAAAIIGELKVKTLIITHLSTIADDWITKTLKSQFPNNSIGQYDGRIRVDGDIVVGLIHSLNMPTIEIEINGKVKKFNPTDFFSRFGLIIYDETQKFNTKQYSKMYSKAHAPYMLGLSATPENCKFPKASFWGIGKPVISENIEGYHKESVSFTGNVHMLKYKGPPVYTRLICNSVGNFDYAGTCSMIISDPFRNQVIVNRILEISDKGLNVFVFSDRRSHLKIMEQIFIQMLNKRKSKTISELQSYFSGEVSEIIESYCGRVSHQLLAGGSCIADMELAENTASVIFTTYPYMDVGKSIVKMNAIILASPRRSNTKQVIGRILRLGSDNTIEREVVDVVDWNIKLKSQWSARKKIYKEKEFEISVDLVSHEDVFIDGDMEYYIDSESQTRLMTEFSNEQKLAKKIMKKKIKNAAKEAKTNKGRQVHGKSLTTINAETLAKKINIKNTISQLVEK